MKKLYLITFSFFVVVFLSSCDKDEKLAFGETLTDFELDTVYKASDDGFLAIESSANFVSDVVCYVYADYDPDSLAVIGNVYDHENASFPIRKNSYWKVSKKKMDDSFKKAIIKISWTPLN